MVTTRTLITWIVFAEATLSGKLGRWVMRSQVEQNESEEAQKVNLVHELFCIWWPDLPVKVLFDQRSEASEGANLDILQKFIVGREYMCKDLLEAEGGSTVCLRAERKPGWLNWKNRGQG